MLSHTVRKLCAVATVKLNLIKRSANKAGLGVFDLISAVPASTCQQRCVLCHDTAAGAACQWGGLLTPWKGNNRLMCSVFYFQILFSAAKMELKFNSNYQFHKQ